MLARHIDDLKQAVATYSDIVTPTNIIAFGIGYLCLQAILRFRREQAIIQRYRRSTDVESNSETKPPNKVEQSTEKGNGEYVDDGRQGLDLSRMSFKQASEIQREISHLEFPYSFGHSLELGFIQVCTLVYSAAEGVRLMTLPKFHRLWRFRILPRF